MDSDAAFELKAAALVLGSLLATTHVLDYDLVVLAMAIAFFRAAWTTPRLRDFEISLRAAAWIVRLVEPAFHAFILRRAALDHTQLPVGTPRVAQA